MEVNAGLEPRSRLQQRHHQLAGGTRIGGGLQHNGGALDNPGGQLGGRRLDERQVRQRLPQRRGHRDDGNVEVSNCVEIVGDHVATRRQCGDQDLTVHVFYERFALRQPAHPSFVQIESDDVVTYLNGPHGERKAHVALTHHQRGERGHTRCGGIGCIDVHN